jgi:hypothetical protein
MPRSERCRIRGSCLHGIALPSLTQAPVAGGAPVASERPALVERSRPELQSLAERLALVERPRRWAAHWTGASRRTGLSPSGGRWRVLGGGLGNAENHGSGGGDTGVCGRAPSTKEPATAGDWRTGSGPGTGNGGNSRNGGGGNHGNGGPGGHRDHRVDGLWRDQRAQATAIPGIPATATPNPARKSRGSC